MTIDLFELAKSSRYESAQLASEGHNATNLTPLKWGESKNGIGAIRDASNNTLEDGKKYAKTIHMHPRWVAQGTIKAWFPWKKLPKYAVFKAQIGFIKNAKHTDGVTFWVWEHHKEGRRQVWNSILKTHKKYTGRLQNIAIDLSHFANQNVGIELRIDAGNTSSQDWAVWVNPRIEMNAHIPSDVKLDGTVLTLEGTHISSSAHDLILDNFTRRKRTSGMRRALVHGFNDELVVNYAGDYPGGTIVRSDLYVADRQNNLRIHLDPDNGNAFFGGKGQDGDIFLKDEAGKTRISLETNKFTAASWPKWPKQSRAISRIELISEIRKLKEELLALKAEVSKLEVGA